MKDLKSGIVGATGIAEQAKTMPRYAKNRSETFYVCNRAATTPSSTVWFAGGPDRWRAGRAR
jgi:hypothetical protein